MFIMVNTFFHRAYKFILAVDFKNLLMGATDAAALMEKQQMAIEGDATRLLSLRELFDQFVRRYPLVTPRDQAMV